MTALVKRYRVTLVAEVEAESTQVARNMPRVELMSHKGVFDWWVVHVEEVPNSPAEVPNSE